MEIATKTLPSRAASQPVSNVTNGIISCLFAVQGIKGFTTTLRWLDNTLRTWFASVQSCNGHCVLPLNNTFLHPPGLLRIAATLVGLVRLLNPTARLCPLQIAADHVEFSLGIHFPIHTWFLVTCAPQSVTLIYTLTPRAPWALQGRPPCRFLRIS